MKLTLSSLIFSLLISACGIPLEPLVESENKAQATQLAEQTAQTQTNASTTRPAGADASYGWQWLPPIPFPPDPYPPSRGGWSLDDLFGN